jgi:hypothetical protein
VSAGAYALACGELAIVLISLGLAAVRVRQRLLPGWDGAPGRLVEAVVGIALAIWLGELLGAVNLFHEAVFVPACALIGLGAALAIRPRAEGQVASPPALEVSAPALLVTVAVAGLLFAHWGFETKQSLDQGITNFDSLWYHMPFSADIVQSGSTTGLQYTDTVFLNRFYPENSELLHAIGILVSGRDTLSLFLNLGWLAIALLAAWCIGRPYGRGHLTVAAAAILLECHTLVVREPGAAKNDAMGVALLLAATAILINAWEARRRRPAAAAGEAEPAAVDGLIGWPLAAAGLAAGLAAGTKLTVLGGVAALTVATIALARPGRRGAAAGWWLGALLAGCAFWYLRNLIVAGNPIPQIQHLGPIGLPGPERVQTARPDFTVLHYATDTEVWSQYFAPGLHRGFGGLWPLVLLLGIGGAAAAIAAGRSRVLRWNGVVALVAMAAYLATPLSAAGADGAPVAFAINIRFLIPGLIIGLVLLPLAPRIADGRRQWAFLALLLAVLGATDRSDAVLRVPERKFGIALALLAVAVPAALLLARRRGAGKATVAAGFATLAVVVAAIGYPLQRDYLRDRFADFDPAMHLDSAYRWANHTEDARIGLAGTTAGFLQYGFFGKDLSNEVRVLGRKGPKGAFNAIPTCRAFRSAVNAEHLDYLVTSPFLNFIHPSKPIRSPEASWLKAERAVRPLNRDGPVTVWRVRGRLDPKGCARLAVPLRYIPDTPGT